MRRSFRLMPALNTRRPGSAGRVTGRRAAGRPRLRCRAAPGRRRSQVVDRLGVLGVEAASRNRQVAGPPVPPAGPAEASRGVPGTRGSSPAAVRVVGRAQHRVDQVGDPLPGAQQARWPRCPGRSPGPSRSAGRAPPPRPSARSADEPGEASRPPLHSSASRRSRPARGEVVVYAPPCSSRKRPRKDVAGVCIGVGRERAGASAVRLAGQRGQDGFDGGDGRRQWWPAARSVGRPVPSGAAAAAGVLMSPWSPTRRRSGCSPVPSQVPVAGREVACRAPRRSRRSRRPAVAGDGRTASRLSATHPTRPARDSGGPRPRGGRSRRLSPSARPALATGIRVPNRAMRRAAAMPMCWTSR